MQKKIRGRKMTNKMSKNKKETIAIGEKVMYNGGEMIWEIG